MDYSFYGGRQGRTYKITAHYDSVHDMVLAFQQGGQNTDVNYHEYVIIDTIVNNHQKSNPENGIIYRRGLDYQAAFALDATERPNYTISIDDVITVTLTQDDLSVDWEVPRYYNYEYSLYEEDGAVKANITTIDFKKEEFENDFSAFVTAPGGGAEYVGQIVGPAGSTPELEILNWEDYESSIDPSGSVAHKEINLTLTPGLDEMGEYHDTIRWGYYNVLDEGGNTSGAVIGIDYPYTVFEYTAESVSPYGPSIIEVEELPEIGQNNVYYKVLDEDTYYLYDNNEWILESPWSAIQEDENWTYYGLIREKNISRTHPYYKSYDIRIPVGIHGQDVELLGVKDFDGKDKLYYKTRQYNNTAEGEVSEADYPIADYNVIKNVTTNAGPVTYGFREPTARYEVGDRVKEPSLNYDTTHRVLSVLQPGVSSSAAALDLSGALLGARIPDGTVVWTIVVDKQNPATEITVSYTADEDDVFPLRQIYHIDFDEVSGNIYATYADQEEKDYLGRIANIDSVYLDDDNYLVFKWKTTDAGGNPTTRINLQLRTVNKIWIENEGDIDSTKKFKVNYNIGKNKVGQDAYISETPLNDLLALDISGDALIALYSDPTYRNSLPTDRSVVKDGEKWEVLGAVNSGNHIFGQFDSLDDLRSQFPRGFTNPAYMGWIVTIEDSRGLVQQYAYDYQGNLGWYEIAGTSAEYVKPEYTMVHALATEDDYTATAARPANQEDAVLNVGGYWFVLTQ